MTDHFENTTEQNLCRIWPNKFLYSLGWSWVYLIFAGIIYLLTKGSGNKFVEFFLLFFIFYVVLAIPVRMAKCGKVEYRVTNKAIYIVTPSVKDVNVKIPLQCVTLIYENSSYIETFFGTGTLDIYYEYLNISTGKLINSKVQMKYIENPNEVYQIVMGSRGKG